MKIKQFTHKDLDGVGSGVVGKVVFGDDIDIEYIGGMKMDVFLSDEEFARVIDNIIKESESENKKS
jgi:oligoribonuclease NrnB/cAMP/cGMP phosphodiesterase (DHH superfamily)